jgi:hypothetical protein
MTLSIGGCNSKAEYQVVVLRMKVRFLPLARLQFTAYAGL